MVANLKAIISSWIDLRRVKLSKLDPVPRVNSCPRGFCCCVKIDSRYQLSKIAEILWVNQQGEIRQFWLQKTLVKFKGQERMFLTNRAYTKHQDIHDQESFRKSGILYSALQSPIQHCVVTAVTFVVRITNGKTPVPVCSPKLSPVGRGWYLEGWPSSRPPILKSISSLLNRNPLKQSKKIKDFLCNIFEFIIILWSVIFIKSIRCILEVQQDR